MNNLLFGNNSVVEHRSYLTLKSYLNVLFIFKTEFYQGTVVIQECESVQYMKSVYIYCILLNFNCFKVSQQIHIYTFANMEFA